MEVMIENLIKMQMIRNKRMSTIDRLLKNRVLLIYAKGLDHLIPKSYREQFLEETKAGIEKLKKNPTRIRKRSR